MLEQSEVPQTSKAPFSGLVIMAVVGLVSAAVAGWALAQFMMLVPYIKLRVFGPFLCGALGGVGLMTGAVWGKIRSTKARLIVGLMLGLFMMYFSWMAYVNILLKEQVPNAEYIFLPTEIGSFVSLILEAGGVWDFGGGALGKQKLIVFWSFETLFAIFSFVAVGLFKNPPFCEACNVWTKCVMEKPVFQFDPEDQIEKQIERKGIAALTKLKIAEPQSAHAIEVVIHECPACSDYNLLTLNYTPLALNKEGVIEKTGTTLIVKEISISPEVVEKLQEMGTNREQLVAEAENLETEEEQPEPEKNPTTENPEN